MALAFVGSFSVKNSLFDVGLLLLFGAIGYFMKKLEFPTAPVVLALVLGPMAEGSLRRSLIMSQGNWSIFVTRPISLLLLILTAISLLYPFIRERIIQKKTQKATSEA